MPLDDDIMLRLTRLLTSRLSRLRRSWMRPPLIRTFHCRSEALSSFEASDLFG